MASFARHMPRELAPVDLRSMAGALVPELGPRGRGRRAGAERGDEAVRSLGGAGLAALVALPFLLIASVVLGQPFAAPAAIAVGFLALSRTLAAGHRRGAALLGAAVLIALAAWPLAFFAGGDAPLTASGLAAVLLSPVFAAAPAGMRMLVAPKLSPAARAARQAVACLDRMAPSEMVLVLAADGTLLSATRAALAWLDAGGRGGALALSDLLGPAALPPLFDAVRRCIAGGDAVDLVIPLAGSGQRDTEIAARLVPAEHGTVSLRLAPVEARLAAPCASSAAPAAAPEMTTATPERRAASDLDAAIAFALRHADARAAAAGIALAVDAEPGIAIGCDRQIARRIVHFLIEGAIAGCACGGEVRLEARRMKGVALVRASYEPTASSAGRTEEFAAAQGLAEQAGGTLYTERLADRVIVSVRLDLAAAGMSHGRQGECAGDE